MNNKKLDFAIKGFAIIGLIGLIIISTSKIRGIISPFDGDGYAFVYCVGWGRTINSHKDCYFDLEKAYKRENSTKNIAVVRMHKRETSSVNK